MVKCFIAAGSAPGVDFCGEYVIAKDIDEARSIILERYDTNDIENFRCHEVSKEQVRLIDLTTGDITRIIKSGGDL